MDYNHWQTSSWATQFHILDFWHLEPKQRLNNYKFWERRTLINILVDIKLWKNKHFTRKYTTSCPGAWFRTFLSKYWHQNQYFCMLKWKKRSPVLQNYIFCLSCMWSVAYKWAFEPLTFFLFSWCTKKQYSGYRLAITQHLESYTREVATQKWALYLKKSDKAKLFKSWSQILSLFFQKIRTTIFYWESSYYLCDNIHNLCPELQNYMFSSFTCEVQLINELWSHMILTFFILLTC